MNNYYLGYIRLVVAVFLLVVAGLIENTAYICNPWTTDSYHIIVMSIGPAVPKL